MPRSSESKPRVTTRAILTDSQFLVPALVLCFGIALLIALH